MKNLWRIVFVMVMSIIVGTGNSIGAGAEKNDQKTSGNEAVRVAVIGGMTMTGLWQEIAEMFREESGYCVTVVKTGQRPALAAVFREGKADLLTMHSGDITTDLVADGYGVNMRPWTHNNLVIVGPASDPAGIRGMKNGAAAFRRIADTKSCFVDFRSIGPREMSHKLWRSAGVVPKGNWIIKDESTSHYGLLSYAREHNAYGVFGRMPILLKKVDTEGMAIMVENDPEMHRPYIVMEANPACFSHSNSAGARALADFLVSEKVQTFLATFRAREFGGIPLFYPLRSAAFKGSAGKEERRDNGERENHEE